MIKLKLDKFSDRFIELVNLINYSSLVEIKFTNEKRKNHCVITLFHENPYKIKEITYFKKEFYTAWKDFLILNKIMEKNNDKK